MINSINSSGGGCNAALLSVYPSGRNAANSSQIADNMFAKMDSNSDGFVDKAELSSIPASMPADQSKMPTATDSFSRFDADGDGKLTKEEHSQGLRSLMHEYGSHMRGLHRPDPDELFAKADADGNGSLDKSELKSFLEQGPGGADKAPRVDELFAKLDRDGDGSISKDENKTGIEARRQESDSNVNENPFAAYISLILQQYQTHSRDTSLVNSAASLSVVA
jgi:Ca2+-binding EF-hand superfamily protein